MGLLLSGLAGAFQGYNQLRDEERSKEANRQLIEDRIKAEEAMQLRKEDRARTERTQTLSDINLRSQQILSTTDAGLINANLGSSATAEDAAVLQQPGMDAARKAYGLNAVDEEARLKARLEAKLGLGVDASDEQSALAQLNASKNADRQLTKDEEQFKIQMKRIDAQIAQTNAADRRVRLDAALKKSEAEAAAVNKKELQAEYVKLGDIIATKQANPKADLSAQMSPVVIKIASLGGNPAAIIDLLLGQQTKEQVATKVGDDDVGSVTTTTTTKPGARVGGVLGVGAPPASNVSTGKIRRPLDTFGR